MSGLLRRIRRPGAAEESRTEPIALPEPAHGSAPTAPDGEPAAPVRADERPLPAGTDPEDLERRSTTGRRGKLRRRARFLRRARELALRDLGGLVYEARRREQDGSRLIAEKVGRLAAIDEELRSLETELGTPRAETVVREPGVGGTCPRCGEVHASDARFCSSCGLDLTPEPAAAQAAQPAAAPEPAAAQAAQPAAAQAAQPAAAQAAQPAAAPESSAAEAAQPAAAEAAQPAAAEAAQPAAAEAAQPAAAEAARPAAAEAAQPAAAPEPAATEAPTAEQSGNGRATPPETAARPEPADTPDRDRSA